MKGQQYSTKQAANKLGVAWITLQKHVNKGTFPAPPLGNVGGVRVRLWTASDIECARKVLSKLKPGRKKKA